MALNKTAAACRTYFAYVDQALDFPNPPDFVQMLTRCRPVPGRRPVRLGSRA
jgi:hypothetical protein